MSSKPSRCQRETSQSGARARNACRSGQFPEGHAAPRRPARPGAALLNCRRPTDDGAPIEGRWAAMRRAHRRCAVREQLGFPAAGGTPLDGRARRRVARCRRRAAGPSGARRRGGRCVWAAGQRVGDAHGQPGCPHWAARHRGSGAPTRAPSASGSPCVVRPSIAGGKPAGYGAIAAGGWPTAWHVRAPAEDPTPVGCATRAGWSLVRGRPSANRPARHRPHAHRFFSCGGP